MREIRGCEIDSKYPYEWAEGTPYQMTTNRCPVREIEIDVCDMSRVYHLADKKISITEQEQLPNPFLEAVAFLSTQNALADRKRLEQIK